MLSELEQIDQSAKLCMQFVSIEDDINDCQEIIDAPLPLKSQFKTRSKKQKLQTVCSLFVFIWGMILYFSTRPSYIDRIMYPEIYKDDMLYANLFLIIPIFSIVFLITKAVRSSAATNKAYSDALVQHQKEKDNAAAKIKSLQPQYEELKKQVYDKSICIFPDDYIYGAGYINDLIRNKRADTLKEAINIYVQDMQNLALRDEMSSQLNSLGNEMRNVSNEVRDLRYETAYQGRMQQKSTEELARTIRRK